DHGQGVDRLGDASHGGPCMTLRSLVWRRLHDRGVKALCGLAAGSGCALLVWILFIVYQRGSQSLHWAFFTHAPPPPFAAAPVGAEPDFDFGVREGPADKDPAAPAAAQVSVSAGGMGNDIIGSLLITGLATLLAVPIGVLAGFYLAEFGRHSWVASAVRFSAN